MPDLSLIFGIKYRIVEPKNVSQRHVRRVELLYGISDGTFHHMHRSRTISVHHAAVAQVDEHHARQNTNQERERSTEDKRLLHEYFPLVKNTTMSLQS